MRVRNGKTQISDGPFADTKEQLGGFYLMDCKDLEQALETLAEKLANYQPYYAAHADMMVKLGRLAEAKSSYQKAIRMS